MNSNTKPLRVLHSFPHRLGKARICTTAWYEIDSTAAAGAELLVLAGDSVRPFPRPVTVKTTLARGKIRIPNSLLGTLNTCKLHDWIVAHRGDRVEHGWPVDARGAHTVLDVPLSSEEEAGLAASAATLREVQSSLGL